MNEISHINTDNTRPQRQGASTSEIHRTGFIRHYYTLSERPNPAGQQDQSAQSNDGNSPRSPETDHQTAGDPFQEPVDGNATIRRVRQRFTSLLKGWMGNTLRNTRNVFWRGQRDNTINPHDRAQTRQDFRNNLQQYTQ